MVAIRSPTKMQAMLRATQMALEGKDVREIKDMLVGAYLYDAHQASVMARGAIWRSRHQAEVILSDAELMEKRGGYDPGVKG